MRITSIRKVKVVPYIGTWIETPMVSFYPSQALVVPYIGTWIETYKEIIEGRFDVVVPYIGTWIETPIRSIVPKRAVVVPYIGTWIETSMATPDSNMSMSYLI